MNKIKPNLTQLRKLVIFWLTNIIESKHGLDSSLEYVKKTRAGPKEFFGAIFYTYSQLTESDRNEVDELLEKNGCFSLRQMDTDSLIPKKANLENNPKYMYMCNFVNYIEDLQFSEHSENCTTPSKGELIGFEKSISKALKNVEFWHMDSIDIILDIYLAKTASAITNLSPDKFNEIDTLAQKHGILKIKEAYNKFSAFRRKFKEKKHFIESPEYLNWKGTGTHHLAKRKKKVTSIDDPKMFHITFSTSMQNMHPVLEDQKNVVNIEYTGSYSKDAEQAYKLSNIPSNDLYVWHYNGSYDPETKTGQVELVLKEAHDAIEHATGVEDYEKLKGVSYKD